LLEVHFCGIVIINFLKYILNFQSLLCL
jgi:hypothetical protein